MREMKDSGIEWIGEIPKDWKVSKVGMFYNITLGKMLQSISKGNDTLEKYLCALNLSDNKLSLNNIKQMWFSNLEKEEYRLKKGDLLVVEGGDVGSSAILEFEPENLYFQNALHRVRAKYGDNRFLKYWLIFSKSSGYFDIICNRATIAHFTKDKFKSIPFVFVTMSEQNRIADYLDKKCSKIDEIISKQQTVIEKLKEYKLSIITEAVTKGLNPDVTMKDSGVEWIGEIPEHWEITKIKHKAILNPKCDFSHVSYDTSITYAPMECIKNGYYNNRTEILSKIPSSLTPFEEGDIVMAKVTPCFENGNIAIMNNLQSKVGLGSSELFVFRSNGILTKYLFYFLQNINFTRQACLTMTGAGGLKRVSSEFCKNCKLPLPPYIEQEQISDYLDSKCEKIDFTINKKQKLIDKLTEYKKSLIYEVVTGKKEV